MQHLKEYYTQEVEGLKQKIKELRDTSTASVDEQKKQREEDVASYKTKLEALQREMAEAIEAAQQREAEAVTQARSNAEEELRLVTAQYEGKLAREKTRLQDEIRRLEGDLAIQRRSLEKAKVGAACPPLLLLLTSSSSNYKTFRRYYYHYYLLPTMCP